MEELEQAFPQLQKQVKLAPFSTFQVGGPADFFLVVKNKEELKKAYLLAQKHKINTFILGGGSNLIFADEGFRGLVIKNEAGKIEVNKTQIYAESGAIWSKLIQTAIEHNLKGLENLMGLPGTIGAAVRGNAGCHGVEMKDLLIKATVLNGDEEQEVTKDYFEFKYRESKLKKHPQLVLSVTLQLQNNPGTQNDLRETMKNLLLDRRDKQPTGKNAGSFFKNPEGTSAGRLIDECGLKGMQVGDAQVSDKHANFFMNLGNATQKNILNLASQIVEKVYDKTKTRLEQEVHIIDEYGKLVHVS